MCWKCVEQQSENVNQVTATPLRTLASQSSKISRTNGPLERPPMLDISNDLHALVDSHVSNLLLECDFLAPDLIVKN